MWLADMGTEVIRITAPDPFDITARSRPTISLDLDQPEGIEAALQLIDSADILIEGFRPGVMERLGLSPQLREARNAKLVYDRMMGWDQYGPLSHPAGHDINYIALSGVLHAIGRTDETPVVPFNLVGDFGGGAMFLAFDVLRAAFEARRSGEGQLVDAAMTDGVALLSAMTYGFKAADQWNNQRGENLLDGGAHFFDTDTCADNKFVAIGAIEPQFYARLRELCGIDEAAFDVQLDSVRWPLLKPRMVGNRWPNGSV